MAHAEKEDNAVAHSVAKVLANTFLGRKCGLRQPSRDPMTIA